ncbi:MAG: hypothetical protein M4D80_42370 [Myxococcota bacterium]|nr:hypothetical protein [Myxococcota bacterium]
MLCNGPGWGWRVCVLVALGGTASANVVNLSNGITGQGHLDVDVDDFGSYGREVSPNTDDNFWPLGVIREENQTFMASSFLFISAPIAGAVALSTHKLIIDKVELMGDGIKGPATLTRTVTSAIALTGGVAHSELRIADAPSNVRIDVKLDQRIITTNATSSRLAQDYEIQNTGTAAVTLVFHTFWDMDLYFTGALFADDVIGAGPGLCYVYQHDPQRPLQGGSLIDGGSTTPMSSYYAGKEGHMPNGGPAYVTADSPTHPEWDAFGMPMQWRNNVAFLGTNVAGSADTSADAMIGMEWRFTLAPNETHTIRVRRVYGTNALPCNVSVTCGNGTVEAGETCDGEDSPTCNKETCTAPACGDGYTNAAAGEECESARVDSIDCNGTTCKTSVCGDGYANVAAGEACDDGEDTAACNLENCQPAMCGDAVVNVAANEDCETGELCDLATCTYSFSIGGGCGGCAGGGDASWAVLIGLVLLRPRGTRRRAPPRGSNRSGR